LTRSRQESGVRENRPRRSIGRGLETGAWRTAPALDPTADQDATQVPFTEHENVIQTLPSDRTDEALREGILPWALGGREDFLDPQALHAAPKRLAVDLVAVVEEIGWCGVVREGVHDLLGGPVGGGMLGDVEVQDATAMVGKHDEDEEDTQAGGGNGEEIDGDQVPDVIGEERLPGLGWRCAPPRHQPGHGSLGHVDAELEELGMNTWRTPERIRRGHTSDQGLDLGVDRRAAAGGPGRRAWSSTGGSAAAATAGRCRE